MRTKQSQDEPKVTPAFNFSVALARVAIRITLARRWRGLVTFLLGALVTFAIPAARATIKYVSSGDNSIVQVSSAGVVSPFATLPAGSVPAGLAFDASGNLYAADSNTLQVGQLSKISKITSGGVVSLFATLPPGSGPFWPLTPAATSTRRSPGPTRSARSARTASR
jgi:hypothetical protein